MDSDARNSERDRYSGDVWLDDGLHLCCGRHRVQPGNSITTGGDDGKTEKHRQLECKESDAGLSQGQEKQEQGRGQEPEEEPLMRVGKILMVGVAASILFGSAAYAAEKKPKQEWTSTWTFNKKTKTWKQKAVRKSTECWIDVYLRNRDKKK